MEAYIVCTSCGTIYKQGLEHKCPKVYCSPSPINNYIMGGAACLAILTIIGCIIIILHMLTG
jgi:hypothetical protein